MRRTGLFRFAAALLVGWLLVRLVYLLLGSVLVLARACGRTAVWVLMGRPEVALSRTQAASNPVKRSSR